jgi:hypothetical protein
MRACSSVILGDFLLHFLLLGSIVKTQLIYFTTPQGSRSRIPMPSLFFCLQSVSVSFDLSQDPKFFVCSHVWQHRAA